MSCQMKYEHNEELTKMCCISDSIHDKIFWHFIGLKGVTVGVKNYNNIIYADDTSLLPGNDKEL